MRDSVSWSRTLSFSATFISHLFWNGHPLSSISSRFLASFFKQACELAPIFNELVDCVSLDGESLQAALSRQVLNSIHWILVVPMWDLSFYNFIHEFTARLLDIHDKMMLIKNKEDIRLILHRSYYMLDSETNSLLQIENSRSYCFATNAATFCCSI
ncbi:Glutathione synthetase chloroplastic, partial [Zea mays]